MGLRRRTVEGLVTTDSKVAAPGFWQGKRVLLTGHTGFKGSWLTLWLQRLGAEVTGVSLPPVTTPNLFELAEVAGACHSNYQDLGDAAAVAELTRAARPEIVFHLAAQPLVRTSYCEPLPTLATNVMGTAHVLDSLRGLTSARVAVIVTTDKVYRNTRTMWPRREDDPLGGHDPYSASKAASEFVVDSYRDAFLADQGVAVASARSGNVIGGGDWSKDRLIPDAVRAWEAQGILHVRRPQAIRPWQHVLEPLSGYLTLARKLWDESSLADAYNFGPETHEAKTVRELVELARAAYGLGGVLYADGVEGPYETSWLSLEISKARTILGFTPKWSLVETVERTTTWYRKLAKGASARALCEADIVAYEA